MSRKSIFFQEAGGEYGRWGDREDSSGPRAGSRSRDRYFAKKTGAVHFDDSGVQPLTCGEFLKLTGIDGGRPKPVFADDDPFACGLAVNLADKAAGRLDLKPLQSVLPKSRGVGGKKDGPT